MELLQRLRVSVATGFSSWCGLKAKLNPAKDAGEK